MTKSEINHQLAKSKILIADAPARMCTRITQELEERYDVVTATTGLQVLKYVTQHHDIIAIVIDLSLSDSDALTTARALKSDFSTYHIPIIIVADDAHHKTMINAIEIGVDDYLQKPFNAAELHARLIMNIRRTERDQSANPLTKLPGNGIINRTILQRLTMPLSILYADLDNFKAYNDSYGFNKGDLLLKNTAEILTSVVKLHGNATDFLGHLGGDDFVIISTPNKAEIIAHQICTQFDEATPSFYNEEDQKRKKIVAIDRTGNQKEFPLASISIAIVNNEKKELTSIPHIAQLASELKRFAKSKPDGIGTSNYVKDRRR